jgi:hypothetical protein
MSMMSQDDVLLQQELVLQYFCPKEKEKKPYHYLPNCVLGRQHFRIFYAVVKKSLESGDRIPSTVVFIDSRSNLNTVWLGVPMG